MQERHVYMLLTREFQFCSQCWAVGKRVQVVSVARRAELSQKAYRQYRRRAAERHYRVEHPEYLQRITKGAST